MYSRAFVTGPESENGLAKTGSGVGTSPVAYVESGFSIHFADQSPVPNRPVSKVAGALPSPARPVPSHTRTDHATALREPSPAPAYLMLLVSLEATLPESHRSGVSSCAALDATRTSYAVWRPPDRRQLKFGVASLSPIGFVSVFARSVWTVTALPSAPAGAFAAPTSSTPHAVATTAAATP